MKIISTLHSCLPLPTSFSPTTAFLKHKLLSLSSNFYQSLLPSHHKSCQARSLAQPLPTGTGLPSSRIEHLGHLHNIHLYSDATSSAGLGTFCSVLQHNAHTSSLPPLSLTFKPYQLFANDPSSPPYFNNLTVMISKGHSNAPSSCIHHPNVASHTNMFFARLMFLIQEVQKHALVAETHPKLCPPFSALLHLKDLRDFHEQNHTSTVLLLAFLKAT